MSIEPSSKGADVELVQVGDVLQKLAGTGSNPEKKNFCILILQ